MQKPSHIKESIVNQKLVIDLSQKYDNKILSAMVTHEFHNCYEIYYLLKGEVDYFVGDKIFRVHSGDVVIIPPGVIHKTKQIKDIDRSRLLLFVSESFIQEYLNDRPDLFACLQSNLLQMGKYKNDQVKGLFMHLLEEHNARNPDYAMIKAVLVQLLITLERMILSNTHTALTGTGNAARKHILKIVQYINEHYSEEINLNTVSEDFHLNPSYISRSFKKEPELYFTEHLMVVRIRNACNLLLNTNLKIMDIAKKTGYKSSNHFCKAFKSIMKISPMNYRKLS